MEKRSVEPVAETDDAGLARAVLAVMEAHRARTAERGAESPQLPLSAREGMPPIEDQLASVDSPATSLASGTTAILADQSDPSVLPQTDSPSLAFGTTILADQPEPSVLPVVGRFFSSVGRTQEAMEKASVESDANADDAKLSRADQLGRNILALMEAHRARTAVPGATSPRLSPWLAVPGAVSPQLPPTDSPPLASGTTATLADRPNRPVGKYFFGVGSVLTALLIVIAYELGSPSDGPFKSSSEKTGVASHNPGTSVGPSLVSDGIVTSSGDGSIDLPDGGKLTGQSSQSRSESSIGSREVIRSKAIVLLPSPSHAPSTAPDEPGISQGAQLPTKISYRAKRKSIKSRPKRFRR